MRTLVAFASRDRGPVPQQRVRAAVTRVERWYAPLWGGTPRADATRGRGRGLLAWSDPADRCRWPGWVGVGRRAVATLHVPLGYERLVGPRHPGGAEDLAATAVRLAEHLAEHPGDVRELTPPFVLATCDPDADALTLQTDGYGLGRLFEVETDELVVWSNRPVAALLFAGVRAEADPLAWRRMAGCDWPMGAATPYRGVSTVGAATRVDADPDGVRRSCGDALGLLDRARRDPLAEGTVATTAAALTGTARAVAGLWPGVPTLSLSGGRDSRLVAAAFLAAGVEVRFRTYDGASGEARTARDLLARLPGPVDHEVAAPGAARRPGPGVLSRARRWHDMTEGLRPALYLRGAAPRRLPAHGRPLVCGVGGELGHTPGYPDDVEELERLPPERRTDAFTRSLLAKITLPSGPNAGATGAVEDQVGAVLDHAAARGVTDAKALDWFYLDERLRRWGMTGESTGRVLPLLVPELVEASFGLTTAQSRDSALHTALIERLVPAWSGVPYFSATLRERSAPARDRLWEDTEADLVGGLVEHDEDWVDGFDVAQVRRIWRRAVAGRAAARDELLLQRVVWRAAFSDHLAALNGDPPPARAPANRSAPREPRPGPRPLHVLATYANDVPVARRLARTRLGRRLRSRLGV